jgi:hypothetical protein
MKNSLKIAFLAVIVIVTSCKRYEEGPFLSLRSPEKRLLGLWEITELKVDDVDFISSYREDSVYVKFSIIEFEELYINIVKEGSSSSQLSSSTLKFEDGKKKMRFELKRFAAYEQLTAPFYELVPPVEFDNAWDIYRLTSKEFIIGIQFNGVIYRLTFERLEKLNVS